MKKNLLLYGVFLCALSVSSCSGTKSNQAVPGNGMSVENASEVMKYYDTSSKVLKDLVDEQKIKSILGYLDRDMPADSLPAFSNPEVTVQDSIVVMNPGEYFNEDDRQNLKENYERLFRSIAAFYKNYQVYRKYMQDKSYENDNYGLADKIRKEELLLSVALSEYKKVIFDILSPLVEGAKTILTPTENGKKE